MYIGISVSKVHHAQQCHCLSVDIVKCELGILCDYPGSCNQSTNFSNGSENIKITAVDP